MLIVDAQVHVWAANTPERPWPHDAAKPQRDVPLCPDELLREMDAAGVDRTVMVPPIWEGRRNDLALAAAQAHPDRFAVMGRIVPDDPTGRAVLATWRHQRGMLGLRFAFNSPQLSEMFVAGGADWIWPEAEKAELPIYILVPQALVGLVDKIAERHPGLKIVMDHLALATGQKDEAAFRDFDKVLPIARRPNVAAKVSALPCYSTEGYPYRSLHPYIRKVYDAYGPQRMFWGTDLSRSPISYRQNVTMFTEEMPWLTELDKEWILGRGLCEWLGWK